MNLSFIRVIFTRAWEWYTLSVFVLPRRPLQPVALTGDIISICSLCWIRGCRIGRQIQSWRIRRCGRTLRSTAWRTRDDPSHRRPTAGRPRGRGSPAPRTPAPTPPGFCSSSSRSPEYSEGKQTLSVWTGLWCPSRSPGFLCRLTPHPPRLPLRPRTQSTSYMIRHFFPFRSSWRLLVCCVTTGHDPHSPHPRCDDLSCYNVLMLWCPSTSPGLFFLKEW